LMKGFLNLGNNNRATNAQSRGDANTPPPAAARELHRDPVCGTFVSDSTRFQQRLGGETFYYCSEQCRANHGVSKAQRA